MTSDDPLSDIRDEVLGDEPEKGPRPDDYGVPTPEEGEIRPGPNQEFETPLPVPLPPTFLSHSTAELHVWHDAWLRDIPVELGTDPGGIAGLKFRAKRLVRKIVLSSMRETFERQRVFNTVVIHNVRMLQKAVKKLAEETVFALVQRTDALYTVHDRRLERLRQELLDLRDELRLADRETRALLRRGHETLRSAVDRMARPHQASADPIDRAAVGKERSRSESTGYVDFENAFRGDEQLIAKRQRFYLERFRSLQGPLLDIGSGRGEFLSLCKEEGIEAYGIDSDQGMVDHCLAKGLDVRREDLILHFEGVAQESLGGIFMAQVIEHLDRRDLASLVSLLHSRLKRGGLAAVETQNPLSPMVLSRNFYLDPTHDRPLHPEGLRFLFEASGFDEVEVAFLSPFPDAVKLAEIPVPDGSDERLVAICRGVNQLVRELNDTLYGYQDFAILARRA